MLLLKSTCVEHQKKKKNAVAKLMLFTAVYSVGVILIYFKTSVVVLLPKLSNQSAQTPSTESA